MNNRRISGKGLAFIFDLDGVIVDSTALHAIVWKGYLAPYGIDGSDIQERMHGKHNGEIVRRLFGGSLSDEEVFAHGARKEALYRSILAPQLEENLVPGIREFLGRHAGTPMAVASNAEPANVEFILDKAGLRHFFQVVVDGDQVARPKPFPDIYWKVSDLLGVPPADCIIFEDSLAGIAAAREAGTRLVGIQTTCQDLPGVALAINDFLDPRLETWLASQHVNG